MISEWALSETEDATWEDERLNDRLTKLLSDLGARPQMSIPAACGGLNETVAAYRFFDNDEVTPETILEPHFCRSQERIAAESVVLLIQDTTEFNLTRPQQQVQGAGPLRARSQRGAFLHLMEAFTPEGTPLGAVSAKMWTREDNAEDSTRQERKKERRKAPIEEKESFRWLEGLRSARQVAARSPQSTCVCIGDSESDLYEMFAEERDDVHWLIRAGRERLLATPPEKIEAEEVTVRTAREAVLATPVLLTKEISVRERKQPIACKTSPRQQARDARKTHVEVRAATVTLATPERPHKRLSPVTVNVVLVQEPSPPENEVPVEWLLVTTLPINTQEQVRTVVQYYAVRFMIELLFRVLKSGCRVEERRFEQIDRFLACTAVYLIVAWRTLMVCRLGHSCPDLDCEAVFEPAEWKAVWMVVKQEPPPVKPPKLGTVIRLVAQLGGYIDRTNRPDPPGPQTVWIGLQRTRDLAWAWISFGPGTPTKKKTKPV